VAPFPANGLITFCSGIPVTVEESANPERSSRYSKLARQNGGIMGWKKLGEEHLKTETPRYGSTKNPLVTENRPFQG